MRRENLKEGEVVGAISGSTGVATYATVSVYNQPDDIAQLENVRRQLQATLQRLGTGASSTEAQQQTRQIEKQIQQIDVRIAQIRTREAQTRSSEEKAAVQARQTEDAKRLEARRQAAEEDAALRRTEQGQGQGMRQSAATTPGSGTKSPARLVMEPKGTEAQFGRVAGDLFGSGSTTLLRSPMQQKMATGNLDEDALGNRFDLTV